ncbi:hypothetical protein LCGC14_0400370 [marine sediment metagenome]|uniref:Uncharacterized protein n=1 Tax=marine sediment metagenome TaxID=412755 RepID=A0A0F9TF42_9ZZZZ
MTDETKQESSESSEEQDLAQAALDATDSDASAREGTSPAEEPEQQTVPVAKHVALRERAQAAEVAQARAEGELVAIKQAQTQNAPASKSPLQLEIERQAAEGIDKEDMTVSPTIIEQNDIYNQQVANKRAADSVAQQLGAKQLASTNKARAEHKDWSDVVKAADGLLTQGELVDIAAAGDNFGELAYAKSKVALERNKPASETDTAPEKKPSKSEAEAKEKTEAEAKTVPSQQQILKEVAEQADAQTVAAAQL